MRDWLGLEAGVVRVAGVGPYGAEGRTIRRILFALENLCAAAFAPTNLRPTKRKNDSQRIGDRLARSLGVRSASICFCAEHQWKKPLHTAMCRVPRSGYQRHGAIGQEKQSTHTGPHHRCFQKTAGELSGRHRVLGHSSSERGPDTQNVEGKRGEDCSAFLDRSGFSRPEQIHGRRDFKKSMICTAPVCGASLRICFEINGLWVS